MHIKLFIVTYVIQIYWKDVNTVSVPIIWPDGNSNYYNNNGYSNRLNENQATTAYANRRNENIYNRPNADFNRLLFSKLFNFGQTSDPQQTIDAVDFNDKPETPINNAITAPPPEQDDYDDSETATTTTTTTTTQTPPIVQVDEIQDTNNGQRGWRRKRPCVPIPFTHRIGRQANQYNSGSSGRTIFNVYYSNVDGNNHGGGSQNDKPLYDSYGGYICAPNYGNHHHQNNRPQRPQHSNNNNNYNGGGLGFFGPGGLFDFSNNNSGGSSSSSSTGVLADSVSDTVKPVVEVNVQDTVQDVQQLSWRPLVGGIASTVNGFIQQITNNPNQAVRQINRELYSYIRPIRRFF